MELRILRKFRLNVLKHLLLSNHNYFAFIILFPWFKKWITFSTQKFIIQYAFMHRSVLFHISQNKNMVCSWHLKEPTVAVLRMMYNFGSVLYYNIHTAFTFCTFSFMEAFSRTYSWFECSLKSDSYYAAN